MGAQAIRDEVVKFFNDFVTAFRSFSGEQIAALYLVPNVSVSADGTVRCLQTREDVGVYFQSVVDSYYGDGCRSCRYKDLDVVQVGSRSALGIVTWELLREDESVLKSWRESYNLTLSSGGLKVFASTDHVE